MELLQEPVQLLGGLVFEDGSRADRVLLRPVSGREEDWVARHPGAPVATTVSALLGSCVALPDGGVSSPELARSLLTGDRDYLMTRLRRATFGDRVDGVYTCPACAEPMDVRLDLGEMPWEPAAQGARTYERTLPDGRLVRFRLPCGADQEAIVGVPVEDAVDLLLRRCVLTPESGSLESPERDQLVDAIEGLAPRVEIELSLTCPECEHTFEVEFDPNACFIAELAASHATLLREVHHLAFHYGWSEIDILAMDRTRRRLYLSLLSDELRVD